MRYVRYVYMSIIFFFKQKTAYEMRISDWSSDVCSSDLAVEQRRPDLLGGGANDTPAFLARKRAAGVRMRPALKVLVRILDHHDRRINHRADRDGDAAQRHDVGVYALEAHHDERGEHAERQGDDGDQRRAHVPQEQGADQPDDDELFRQFVRQVLDRSIDELRPVIGGDDLDSIGKALLELLELGLDRRDRRARVSALSENNHAACDFALAVELGYPAPQLGPDLDGCDIAERDRNPASRDAQRNGAEVGKVAQVPRRSHHVLGHAHLDYRTAGFLVRGADRLHHVGVGHPQRRHPVGLEHDLILLDHTADAGDLGDSWNGLELVAQEPVLETAQARPVVAARAVAQPNFVDSPAPRPPGPERPRPP